MRNKAFSMGQCHKFQVMMFAVLLTGCSSQPTHCDSFVSENIWFAELEDRFPIKTSTSHETQERVDSSRFNFDCLNLRHPELVGELKYHETRKSRNGEEVFLFWPSAVTDTLVGFIPSEGGSRVVIVGML
ncbi:hypothetical protein [Novosphingobium sp. MBES04]|uniref:hypothetical protein n=1 Tax=Novosphingobium sp. MBES04 TaxID=1206458 RepID=UPI001185FDA1|nr:hypothetical protein [Novosphingobium sp. MBES04]